MPEDENVIDYGSPVIFLGVADGVGVDQAGTALESVSLFRLSRVKPHFSFPAIMRESHWCFLVQADAPSKGVLHVQILTSAGATLGNIRFGSEVFQADLTVPADSALPAGPIAKAADPGTEVKTVLLVDKGQWVVQTLVIRDLLVPEPGEYRVVLQSPNGPVYLGKLVLGFMPPPPLTEEELSAFESNPLAPKCVQLTFSCKHCDSKLKAYASASTKQLPEIEEKGFVFYTSLPDLFECSCSKTKMNLRYTKIGMHGFLRDGGRVAAGDISFVKRYAQARLNEIAGKFLTLLQKEKREEVIQKFLEQNKVLFARFHAKRLFIKPRILGKFNADFAILDSEGVLTLFELESPAIRLFKKNGHLRADLNHAYEQVQDWLTEVSKHRAAVIEGLGLKADEVLSIRGYVIAGRSKIEKREHLGRHMSSPRLGIEFCTCDMLGHSLARVAEGLP